MTPMKEPPDQTALLEAIRQGDPQIVNELYRNNRETFLQWARRRSNLSEDDLLDIFQDAIIAFYTQVIEGKITTIKVSVDAYLFGIARHLLYHKVGKQRHTVAMDEPNYELLPPIAPEVIERIELTHQQKLLKGAIGRLSDICRRLLTLFYYHEHGLAEIAVRMNYKNKNVVKNQKKRCMQKLTQLLTGD